MTRLGLVALGDSITNGHGNASLGVPCQSWALWLARALDLPFTAYAVDGARAADVATEQLPRLQADYDVGCLYMGVNDARSVDFDLDDFTSTYAAVLKSLAAHSSRCLVLTIPLDLGRPPAGARKVGEANIAIRAAATAVGAAIGELHDLRGWRLIQPDAVHPSAAGQLEIADRAARALGAPNTPSKDANLRRGAKATARYAPTWGRLWVRDVARRGIERIRLAEK